MKEVNILKWVAIGFYLILCLNQTLAQEQVSQGSAHSYSVTPFSKTSNYIFHWSVNGGTSSNTESLDTTVNIVWDGVPGRYTISVFPEKSNSNCLGDTQSLIVNVLSVNIFWMDTAFTQCPKTVNETGDFSIMANYTGISGTWSFSYSIDGNTPLNINGNNNNSVTIIIPGFTNASNSLTATHTIRIVSITTPDNVTHYYTGNESDASTRIIVVTVEPTPGTSGIIQL